MKKDKLIFKDMESKESKQHWLNRELKDAEHTYHIPGVRTAFPLSFHRRNLTAVDIGSNLGAFCLYAKDIFQNIYGFEASYNTFLAGRENIKQLDNIKTYNLAASRFDDEILKIAVCPTTELSRDTSFFHVSGQKNENIEEVKTISLDGIYKKCKIDYIDYLKIDCEGSEYEFLMDKDLSKIDYLTMEIHPGYIGNTKAKELLLYLNKYFILNYTIGEHILFYRSKIPYAS
jgi:FkbM family methyltransferase